MLDRQRLLEWQAERENEDRRWRLTELLVLGGFVTVVLVVAQIVAAFIQR